MNTPSLTARLIAAALATAVTYGIVTSLVSLQAPQRGQLWARIEQHDQARLAAARAATRTQVAMAQTAAVPVAR